MNTTIETKRLGHEQLDAVQDHIIGLFLQRLSLYYKQLSIKDFIYVLFITKQRDTNENRKSMGMGVHLTTMSPHHNTHIPILSLQDLFSDISLSYDTHIVSKEFFIRNRFEATSCF